MSPNLAITLPVTVHRHLQLPLKLAQVRLGKIRASNQADDAVLRRAVDDGEREQVGFREELHAQIEPIVGMERPDVRSHQVGGQKPRARALGLHGQVKLVQNDDS